MTTGNPTNCICWRDWLVGWLPANRKVKRMTQDIKPSGWKIVWGACYIHIFMFVYIYIHLFILIYLNIDCILLHATSKAFLPFSLWCLKFLPWRGARDLLYIMEISEHASTCQSFNVKPDGDTLNMFRRVWSTYSARIMLWLINQATRTGTHPQK